MQYLPVSQHLLRCKVKKNHMLHTLVIAIHVTYLALKLKILKNGQN